MNGQAFRTLRQRLSLTQQDFATLLGVTASTVHKWETGRQDRPIPRKYWPRIRSLDEDAATASLKLELLGAIDVLYSDDIATLLRTAHALRSKVQRRRRDAR